MRAGAIVNAYLILRQKDEILLHLRRNTGYYDGFYGLVSGHVEKGESAIEALIREAEEEAGIRIDRLDLRFTHCAHRQTDRLNVDLFFESENWEGNITNREVEKCAELKFFPLEELPTNTIDYIASILKSERRYSELGWKNQS